MSGWGWRNPPNTQFRLNRDSLQAQGLVTWLPTIGSCGTSTLRDFRGNYPGAFPGGTANPAWTIDPTLGPVLSFDGGDHISLGTSFPAVGAEFTISLWAAFNVLGAGNYYRLACRLWFSNLDWDINYNGDISTGAILGEISYTGDAGSSDIQAGKLLPGGGTVGQFYNVVFVKRMVETQVYIDGIGGTSVSTSGTVYHTASTEARLGGRADGTSLLSGKLGDFRLYNRGMSSAEIWQLYVNPWELYEPVIPVWSVAWVAAGGTTYNQSISGALTPTAVLLNQTQKVSSGSVTPIASLVNQGQKALAGAITPTGGLLNQTQKILGGSLTPAGGLTNQAQKVLSGTLTPLGQLLNQTQKVLSGNVTPSGVLTATKTALISLVGSLTPSGILTKETQKVLSGTITPVGSIFKQIGKILSGALTPIGVLVASLVSTNLESTFKGMFRGMFRRMK